jgi:hypothetical protein
MVVNIFDVVINPLCVNARLSSNPTTSFARIGNTSAMNATLNSKPMIEPKYRNVAVNRGRNLFIITSFLL